MALARRAPRALRLPSWLCMGLFLQHMCMGALASVEDLFVGYTERNTEATKDQLELQTDVGSIRVKLFANKAPKTVALLQKWVTEKLYDGCTIYRAEPRDGYALIQGGAYSCGRQQEQSLAVEGGPLSRGTLAIIAGTSEFFFSLEPHPEWEGSFTVVGEVLDKESWRVLDHILTLPTKNETHPSGTVLRILVTAVTLNARLG